MAAAPFAAAPFAGYSMVLLEPAMGGGPRLMLAPVGIRLPAGVHLVTPLAMVGSATRTSAGRVLAVAAATGYVVAVPPAAGSLTAATGGLTRFFGGRNAPGHGHGPVALAAASYFSTGLAGLLAGPAGSGSFRAMSVLAKAGDDDMMEPEASASDLEKIEKNFRKRQGPIDSIFNEIRDFEPDIGIPIAESFPISRDEDILSRFAGKMKICYDSILKVALELRAPTPMNREAFIMIGKDLKMAMLECEKGFLQAATLDRAVASLKRLRATSLGCSEDELKPLNTSISTPRPPLKDDPMLVNNYFVYMRYHLDEVMQEVIIFVVQHATSPRSFQELDD